MKTKIFILALLALLTSITASASISSQKFWTDSNGTTWCFETDGSNARLIQEEDPEDFYPCVDGELSDFTIPSIVYVDQSAYTVTAIDGRAFEHAGVITSIIIPVTVTSIGGLAFYLCSSLTSISIPASVTSIGEEIFAGCSSLTSVRLNIETPPSVENWFYKYLPPSRTATLYVPYGSKDAYEAAGYLTEFKEIIEMDPTPSSPIKFADANVRTICVSNFDANGDGKFTFAEAEAVTSIETVFEDNTTISSFDELQYFTNLTSIGNNAFYGCANLTSITLPDNLTSIGYNAFRSCSSLTSLTIPDGVTSIGQSAFYLCSNLASVNIPDGVTTIEQAVFGGCKVLESIIIPDDVTSIGIDAFYNCQILTTIELPEGVTSIGQSAFYNCFALTTINIPSGVTSIIDHTFYNCQSLSSITIPDDVTSIGEYAFNDCKSLTSITIPKNVTSIGDGAFRYCSGLTSLNVLAETPSSIESTTFPSTIAKIRVPEAAVSAYKAATNWSAFSSKIMALGGEDNSITVEEIEENKAAGGSANQTYIVTDAAADDVKAADNVIVHSGDNYTCANLVLSDGEPFETMAEEFTATAATYTRSVSVGNTSGTICVPYAFAKEDGVKYYTVDNTRSDDETIYLSEVAGDIVPAATPVIYIKGSGKTTMTFSGSNAVAKKAAGTGSGTFELRGTFEKTTITESDELAKSYALSGGKFLCSTTKLTINPFRAYLYNTGAVAGARLELSVEDEEPTGITFENAALMSGDAEIEGYYTLDGKRVGSLQKGAVTVIRYANGKSVKVFAK